MKEYTCTSEFGPEEVCTAESPEGAAELYAEDNVDMDVDDPPELVYVTVVDRDNEHEIRIDINTTYTFKAETENE